MIYHNWTVSVHRFFCGSMKEIDMSLMYTGMLYIEYSILAIAIVVNIKTLTSLIATYSRASSPHPPSVQLLSSLLG